MREKLSLAKNILKVRLGRQSLFKLTFAVTYKCNSRCTTCSIWKRKPKNELSTEEIIRFFEKNRFHWINLTGGEVFLRTDITEIVKNIPKKGKKIEILSITTNGVLTDKILSDVKEMLKHVKKLTLTVSIDGPQDTHDKIRGIKCWKQAVETLRQLKTLEKENSSLSVFIGYTISPENAGMLHQTYRAVKEQVPQIKMRDFHVNVYHASENYLGNKSVNLNTEKIMQDTNALKKKKKGFGPVSVLERKYMSQIHKYLETGTCPLPCKALLASIFIDPEGNVYPCTMINETLGNLRDFDYSLEYLLSQNKIKDMLKKIKTRDCPGCWTPCEAYQTILGNVGRIKK